MQNPHITSLWLQIDGFLRKKCIFEKWQSNKRLIYKVMMDSFNWNDLLINSTYHSDRLSGLTVPLTVMRFFNDAEYRQLNCEKPTCTPMWSQYGFFFMDLWKHVFVLFRIILCALSLGKKFIVDTEHINALRCVMK